ncbi:hypothetical protein BC826DRAFT_129314 [Russula brevipes]|nr:hypothetical protein BC826DRAFT_395315 [Russula brevipes]KAI0285160.1 hypothetical protein BC826DRAFT_129314 [Russula brevipes]
MRSQGSVLQSAFKFSPVLDFDQSDLAISPNNAPVRAYEYALNGLLEQLDAIESDGNGDIRGAWREAVREVEKALEDVERKVKERGPRATANEVAKEEVKGYDIESEEPEAALAIPPADVAPIATDAKPVLPTLFQLPPLSMRTLFKPSLRNNGQPLLSLNQNRRCGAAECHSQ